MRQSTNRILMIRPVRFTFNAQTAVNNSFQTAPDISNEEINQLARQEFDTFVSTLRSKDISVTVIEDTPDPHTPDSIYPNNWVSFHEEDASVCLFPMFAPNRRLERKPHILQQIEKHFEIKTLIDLSRYESSQTFLEGTGSIVLDRVNRFAFACLSPRTHQSLLNKFCSLMNFKPVAFHAMDESGQPIYHTNVIMCIASKYAVICLETITNPDERKLVIQALESSGKSLIAITYKQMNCFAGNMLQVSNKSNTKSYLVMSTSAYKSLTPDQIDHIQAHDEIIHSDLSTIERNGGGSARCMIAEIFLPVKQ